MPINLGNNITGETSVYSQIKRDMVEGQLNSGGGAFTPASISGLSLWYDFSDATTYTAPGGALSSIRDKSPAANNATGVGVIDTSGAIFALPCVAPTLDLTLTTPFTLTDYTVFCSQNTQVVGYSYCSWIVFNDGSNISTTGNGIYAAQGGTAGSSTQQSGQNGNGANALSVGNGLVTDGKHTLTYKMASPISAQQWRVDGVNSPMSFYGTPSTVTSVVASHVGAGITQSFYLQRPNNRFGEILVYNRNLTSTEIAQVESYLKVKWGTP